MRPHRGSGRVAQESPAPLSGGAGDCGAPSAGGEAGRGMARRPARPSLAVEPRDATRMVSRPYRPPDGESRPQDGGARPADAVARSPSRVARWTRHPRCHSGPQKRNPKSMIADASGRSGTHSTQFVLVSVLDPGSRLRRSGLTRRDVDDCGRLTEKLMNQPRPVRSRPPAPSRRGGRRPCRRCRPSAG